MEVSSTTSSTTSASIQTEVQKKATDTQEQQISKIIESATKESQSVTAQKTGIGTSLNLLG